MNQYSRKFLEESRKKENESLQQPLSGYLSFIKDVHVHTHTHTDA